ncbi:cell division family protein [Salix suchowensis]|nr:cell division family protein [Salix suchowensis]
MKREIMGSKERHGVATKPFSSISRVSRKSDFKSNNNKWILNATTDTRILDNVATTAIVEILITCYQEGGHSNYDFDIESKSSEGFERLEGATRVFYFLFLIIAWA